MTDEQYKNVGAFIGSVPERDSVVVFTLNLLQIRSQIRTILLLSHPLLLGQLGNRGVALRGRLHAAQSSLHQVIWQTSQRLLHLRALDKQIVIEETVLSRDERGKAKKEKKKKKKTQKKKESDLQRQKLQSRAHAPVSTRRSVRLSKRACCK